ncbi:MAG: hypothetical protein ABIS50_10735 [Luteolibacter sp.]|uniref:hypothetical protein n=1 Tax=Luteolibacter sp. TaxID=1962973 RepID=UPI003266E975
MKSNSLKFLLSAGLFLLPAMSLQAGLNATLQVDINCYFQAKTGISGGVESGQVGVVRLDSKQLLTLIGKEKGIKFANGTLLMVSDDAVVFVADAQGNSIMDVSNLVKIVFRKGHELLHGKVNLTNGKEDSRTYYPISLTFNLTTLKGSLDGIGIEDRLTTAPDGDGVQIIRGNTDCSVNGKGLVNGGSGFYEGTINLKGRNASVQ